MESRFLSGLACLGSNGRKQSARVPSYSAADSELRPCSDIAGHPSPPFGFPPGPVRKPETQLSGELPGQGIAAAGGKGDKWAKPGLLKTVWPVVWARRLDLFNLVLGLGLVVVVVVFEFKYEMSQGSGTLAAEGRAPSSYPALNDRKTVGLVTFEEHAVTPFKGPSQSSTFNTFKFEFLNRLKDRLQNVDLRVQIMDANNITAQVISLNQPTAQAFVNLDECIEFCRKVNEYVYQTYCVKHPKRFFAFATLPTQNGKAAAAELERCVNEYGFVGAMINGYTATPDPTKGLYLDDKQYDPLWEVSEVLQKPIFIHPRVPKASDLNVLGDIPILHGAPYGFGRETVEHVLRIMYAGVFDRFPKLKVCLGHSGEGLSWILPRTDATFRMYTPGMDDMLNIPSKHVVSD